MNARPEPGASAAAAHLPYDRSRYRLCARAPRFHTESQPRFGVVERSTLPIVGASIETLTTQKAEEDLAAMYAYAKANEVDFNLASVDPAIAQSGLDSFNTAYMRRLYENGVAAGRSGRFWSKAPIADVGSTMTWRAASSR